MYLYVNHGKTAKQIADVFRARGVALPISTVYSVLHRLRDTGEIKLSHHRHRPPLYTQEELRYIAQLQEQHNEWTYAQLRNAWKEKYPGGKKLSNYTIWKALSTNNITTKMLEDDPVARDDPSTIEERKEYSRQAIHWSRDMVIFIDEIGFRPSQKRRRGRSRRGRPATIKTAVGGGPRLNVCAAVSPRYGLILYDCLLTSWNAERFRGFMHQLVHTSPFTQQRSLYFIMDNVKFHKSDIVQEVLSGSRIQHEIKFIPRYSPHLNVIEYCFSRWKGQVKAIDQLNTTLTLQQQVERAAALITPEYVNRCMDHVMQVYLHCLEGKPLGEFIPLRGDGKPKAVLDRVAERRVEEEETKEEEEEKKE